MLMTMAMTNDNAGQFK